MFLEVSKNIFSHNLFDYSLLLAKNSKHPQNKLASLLISFFKF